MIRIVEDKDRKQVERIISMRKTFCNIIERSITNLDKIFSNAVMLQGKPGSGKTTLVVELLNRLKEDNVIADFYRLSGHVTPTTLTQYLHMASSPRSGKPFVVVLDDVDCLADEGCLELLKSAFDTKTSDPQNRKVNGRSFNFKFNGFGIIITNSDFNKSNRSIHTTALLDRVQQMCIDLDKEDMALYNAYLVEKYFNENSESLSEAEIEKAVDIFNNDVKRWLDTDAFKTANVNFSIRLIRKFVDAYMMFGDDWKEFDTVYKQLQLASELYETERELSSLT